MVLDKYTNRFLKKYIKYKNKNWVFYINKKKKLIN